jgi:hypothetical protein
MAKGTNAKIKELKGIKPEKITDEQLAKIQSAVNTMNSVHIEIGTMESRKHEMMHKLAVTQGELATIKTELEGEYGTVDINIQDGTINYGDVEADS